MKKKKLLENHIYQQKTAFSLRPPPLSSGSVLVLTRFSSSVWDRVPVSWCWWWCRDDKRQEKCQYLLLQSTWAYIQAASAPPKGPSDPHLLSLRPCLLASTLQLFLTHHLDPQPIIPYTPLSLWLPPNFTTQLQCYYNAEMSKLTLPMCL